MISTRRAALLGLDAPPSPIMAAVLGLWPAEVDDEPGYVIFWATGGGAPLTNQPPHRAPRQRMDLSGLEAAMALQAQERDMREAREVIAALFALEGVF